MSCPYVLRGAVPVKMAASECDMSRRTLNEFVDKLTKYDEMSKAYDELTNEEAILFFYDYVLL